MNLDSIKVNTTCLLRNMSNENNILSKKSQHVVFDGMVLIWHQDICNHHEDVGYFVRFRNTLAYYYYRHQQSFVLPPVLHVLTHPNRIEDT